MSVEIRPFRPEDAPAAAELLSQLVPIDYPATAASLLHLVEALGVDGGQHWVVAEAGGAIAGWAETERYLGTPADDVRRVWAAVRADHRGRGLGARLLDLAERAAVAGGGRQLRSWAIAEPPGGAAFLRGRGYEQVRTERLWSLDPATVDLSDLPRREREAAAAGYRLVPLRDLLDRPHDLYRVFVASATDAPSDIERSPVPFEDWRRLTLSDPLLDPDGSFVITAGDEPAGLAWLVVDREHGLAGNLMTGTVREHRHRGLARLAKLATVRWAVENGVGRIGTGNDSTNRDMLALNEHLGYRPEPDFLVFARRVGPTAGAGDAAEKPTGSRTPMRPA